MKHSLASKFQKKLDEGRIREVCDACLDQMTAMLERAVENKIDLHELTLTLVDDNDQVLVALHAIDELSKIMPFKLPPTMPATLRAQAANGHMPIVYASANGVAAMHLEALPMLTSAGGDA